MLIFLAAIFPGIKLANLRQHNMGRDKQWAEQRFAAMVESRMSPQKTSGIWVDDSPEREWLVIYTGEHIGKTRKTYHDGFMVESGSISIWPENIWYI